MDQEQIVRRAAEVLIGWYRAEGRQLPWRVDAEPYHIWISEIMLQQTRVEAVLGYYERFMQAFPSVQALADAPLDEVLKLWEGLGYYSRARNLHRAAGLLCAEHHGEFPQEYEKIRALPGIGDYTAGAIASIAFGLPEPAVDGNVLRVLTRLTAWDADIAQSATKKTAIALLRKIYPCGADAKSLTQGWMELGQVICVPNGEPKCGECPLQSLCAAHKQGETRRYPIKSPKKARKVENRTIVLLSHNGKYAVRRRPDRGLLARLWEFPGVDGHLSVAELVRVLDGMGISVKKILPCGSAKHIFTHVEWHMVGYTAECAAESSDFEWITPEQLRENYAVPSAFGYYMKLI